MDVRANLDGRMHPQKFAIRQEELEKRMSKDPLERRSYRKSPGRQYGYDYDPLRSQSGSTTSRSYALLVQRPDPRRTRQFLRQSIIAGKRSINGDAEPVTCREQDIA